MRRTHGESWIKHADFILIDVICFMLSFNVAYHIQFGMNSNPFSSRAWTNIALVMLTLDLLVLLFGNYLDHILYRGYLREAAIIVRQIVFLELLTTFFLYLIHEGATYSRTVVFLTGIIASVLLFASRSAWKRFLRKKLLLGVHRYTVVGHGELADRLCREIKTNSDLRKKEVTQIDVSDREACLAALTAILRDNRTDDVIIVEDQDKELFHKVVFYCEKYGCRISVVPYYNDVLSPQASIEPIGEMKLLNFRVTPLDSLYNAMIKRAFDIVVSALGLILCSPLMLFTAIGIKLSSPGPILFRQERIGRFRKPFTMLKFRSMRMNAAENVAWSTNEDPRKTKFGSFIRKFSIDELPQLINVLQGDMSLIGPRPEIPYHVDHFMEEIPLYLVRQQVRPGITGWAQINGFRGDTDIGKRVKYDIWYIENWTLLLDIKIAMKTIFGGMINDEKLN